MGLLTTTVGWFPEPAALRAARRAHAAGEIEGAALRAAEDSALGGALALQLELGLDLPVEGQLDRGDMVGLLAGRLGGIEPAGLVRCFGNRYYRKPRIVGPIERRAPLTVERWQAAQRLCPRPVKAILTGAYTAMDWSLDEHYRSREACCLAFAAVLATEVEGLVAAGVTELEIDEPAISSRPEEMALATEALRRVTAAARGRARTWTHLAYGELGPVLDEVFALPVDGLLLQMVNSDYELLEALGDLPREKLLGAGVVDVLAPEVETVEQVRARIERLLEQVPAERLWIMPDSELRTLDEATARAKLAVMVQAAAALR